MTDELLLMLQDLRLSSPDIVTEAMLLISSPIFHIAVPLAIASVLLWCCDRKKGDWAMMSIVSGMFFGHLLKDVFRNPRPFLTDDRLTPEERAMKGASGYSTPSGHTVDAVTSYGSVIVLVRRWWATVLMFAIIAVIMFSRLWLGVHTVFDLFIGLIVAVIVMAVNHILVSYSYRDDGNFLRSTVIYLLSYIAAMMIWLLIADDSGPIMRYCGLFLGAIIGRQIAHSYVKDERREHGLKGNLVRLIIGWPLAVLSFGIPFLILGQYAGFFFGGLLCSVSIYALIPLIFLTVKSKNEQAFNR